MVDHWVIVDYFRGDSAFAAVSHGGAKRYRFDKL